MANSIYAVCMTCKHYLNLEKCRPDQKIANEAFYHFIADHDMCRGCVIAFLSDSYELPWWDEQQQPHWRADSRSPYGYFDDPDTMQIEQRPTQNLPHELKIYNQFHIFATVQYSQTDDLDDLYCWLLNHDRGDQFLVSSDQNPIFEDAESADHQREAFDLGMGCVACQHLIKIGSAQARRYQGFEIDHQTLYDFLAVHQHDPSPSLYVHAEYQSIPPWQTPAHTEVLEYVGECNREWKINQHTLYNCCYEVVASPVLETRPTMLQLSNSHDETFRVYAGQLSDITDFADWIYAQRGGILSITSKPPSSFDH